jgi:hypothetical protein
MGKMINGAENCIKRLKEISKKNENTKEYSLGDVLLLERFEKQLIDYCKFTKEEVEQYSPSYYNKF